MGRLGLWLLALAAGKTQAASITQCCKEKTVGGMAYKLVDETDTGRYGCKSNCVFEKIGSPGSRFCFKEGDLEVVCDGDGYEPEDQQQQSYPYPCTCGQKKTLRIVGGVQTEVNEYPWMAGLAKSSNHYHSCGATLVSDEWVVTAAHCLTRKKKKKFTPKNQATDAECDAQQGECKDERDCEPEGVLLNGYCPNQPNKIKCCKPNFKQPGDFVVVIGEHDQKKLIETSLTKYLNVSEIIPHPEYRPSSNLNDIALLKLVDYVDLMTYTPACLPGKGEDFSGKLGHIYGWGNIKFDKDGDKDYKSAILLEATQRILSRSDCLKSFQSNFNTLFWTVEAGMLCAGGVVGTDTCQGDSGGPLTVEDATNQHKLVGVTSFGRECARDTPGVFADVAFYRDWLDSEMTGAYFCQPPVEEAP